MAQTKEQLKGKAKITTANKVVFDAQTAMIKYTNDTSKDRAGGGMFRVLVNNIFLNNQWGRSKVELLKWLNKNLNVKGAVRVVAL